MASTIAELLVKFGVDADELDKVDDKFSALQGKLEKVGGKMTDVGKKMTVGVTAPIVAGFSLAVKSAAEEDQQMQVLANTIRSNVAGATDEMINANEAWITSMQNATGIADGEMRDAMAFLVASGMDVAQAQEAVTTAMDASVVTGKDLGTISEAIAKAYNGNVGALGRYGITTKNAAGETMSFEQIMGNLNETMGGAAAAAADTAAGRAAILQAKMADLAENVGMVLIPILDKLTGWLSKIVEWFNSLSPAGQKVLVTLAGVAAAVGPVLIVAGKLVSAFGSVMKAFSLLSKLMMANPWMLLIAAVVALVVIIVTNWDKIVAFLKKTWEWIKSTAGAVWEFLKGIFKKGLDFIVGLIKNWTLIGLIASNWDKIKAGVQKLKDWLVSIWGKIVDFFKGIPDKIGRVLKGVADFITAPFKKAFNAIASLWNNTVGKLSFTVPDWVPGIGGKGFNVPDIPKFHDGGVFHASTPGGEGLALLKDGERVMPAGAGEMVLVTKVMLNDREIAEAIRRFDRRLLPV